MVAGVALALGPEANGANACRFPALATGGVTVLREGAFLVQDGNRQLLLPRALVSGPATAPIELLRTPVLRCCGLVLRPCGIAALVRDLPAGLLDGISDARAVFGAAWSAWEEQVRRAPDERGAVQMLFDFARRQLEGGRAVRHLEAAGRLQALALGELREAGAALGCSQRQFERRFAAAFGLRPKLFQRIARMEGALRSGILAGRCDADHALRHGYYDQSHLVRDFRALAGAAPGELLHQVRAAGSPHWPLRIGAAFQPAGAVPAFAGR